jgi:enoyl-CoA hydratase
MAIIVETADFVRTIVINRPERANSLDPETMSELGAAFTEAEHDDDVRVVILTGAGRETFCAGMDLKAFRQQSTDTNDGHSEPGRDEPSKRVGTEVFTERVYSKPIIAAVNGAAAGGGFGFVLACDIVVAAEHARFGLPEVKRGLVGAGAGSKAALRLPPAMTLELILTGDLIDAARARELGIVNHVVPADELLTRAEGLAQRIAANGPLAVRISKQIVYDVRRLVDDIDIAAVRALAAPAMRSGDAKEGAAAFTEKRTANFTGH